MRTGSQRLRPVVALVFGLIASALVLEFGCQAYALLLERQWMALRSDPNHYYQRSDSALLGYELAPSISIESDGQILQVNRYGIRDASNEIPPPETRKIALLGDSVVFGINHSQESTISARLQALADARGSGTKVLSFGVGGYSLEQMLEHLRRKDAVYDVDHIIYVLNPNDFTRLGSVTEGASNGLYRMYRPAILKSPWMIRKAVYRWHKQGGRISIGWYRWVYQSNGGRWRAQLAELGEYARSRGCALTVVLLPAGCAYQSGGYALMEMWDEVSAFLREANIDGVDATALFADEHSCFTPTDHLTPRGNQLMAELLAAHLEGRGLPDPHASGLEVAVRR